MSEQTHFGTRLRVEPLEQRLLLAGNVMADLIDGQLTITGDDWANAIAIVGGPDGSHLVRSSTDYRIEQAPSTRINGEDGPAVFYGVQSIRVSTGGGDDIVYLAGLSLVEPGYSPGAGPHFNLVISGNLSIETGDGNDAVLFTGAGENTQVGGDLTISTGSGDDTISASEMVAVAGNWTIMTGSGSDSIESSLARIGGSLAIDTGSENDSVTLIRVNVGNDLILDTDAGDDSIRLNSVNVGNDLIVDTGEGNDRLRAVGNVVEGTAYFYYSLWTDTVNGDLEDVNDFGDLVVEDSRDVEPPITIPEPGILASNVTAELIDGELIITGDDLANAIMIRVDAEGTCWVMPLPDDGNSDAATTLINGQVEAAGFIGVHSITVNLHGGDDTLNVHDSEWPGGMPRGRDLILSGGLTLNMGDGNDTIRFVGQGQRIVIGGDLMIDTGAGDDSIEVRSFMTSVGGDVHVVTGAGEDYVTGDHITVAGDLFVDSGTESDTVAFYWATINGSVTVDTFHGDDGVTFLWSNIGGSMTVDTGDGKGRVRFSGVSVAVDTAINTGSGDDYVKVSRSDGGSLAIDTGDGADVATISKVEINRSLVVDLGGGEDLLTAVDNVVGELAHFQGGLGPDMINEDLEEANDFAELLVEGFGEAEIEPDPEPEPAPQIGADTLSAISDAIVAESVRQEASDSSTSQRNGKKLTQFSLMMLDE